MEQDLSAACSFSKRLRGIQSWVNYSWILQGAVSLPLLLTFVVRGLPDPTVRPTNSPVQQKTRLNGCFSAKLVYCISSAEWTEGKMPCVRKESRSEMGKGRKKPIFKQIDSAVCLTTLCMWFHIVPKAGNYRQYFSHTLRHGFPSPCLCLTCTGVWLPVVHSSSLLTQEPFDQLILDEIMVWAEGTAVCGRGGGQQPSLAAMQIEWCALDMKLHTQ